MLRTNNVISTYKLASTEGERVAYDATATFTDLDAYIEPASAEVTVLVEDVSGVNTFSMILCDVVLIEIGDRVVDQYGDSFVVKGVRHYRGNQDVSNHSEFVITKKYQ